MREDILGDNLKFDLDFEKKMAKIYENLNTKLGGFYNLSNLFENTNQDYYIFDGIHYTPKGSELIAEAILTKLKN